jgi:hypothetical protein
MLTISENIQIFKQYTHKVMCLVFLQHVSIVQLLQITTDRKPKALKHDEINL